jgi:acyl carrier protein
MSDNNKWSFDEFRAMIAERLGIPAERIVAEASFLDDLAIDSVRMVELLLEFERLGIEIPPESVWDLQTVGDAYDFYLKQR